MREEVCAVIVILFGTSLFAYFLGAVSSLVSEGDAIKSRKRDKLEQTQAFCEHKHLPPDLSRAIMAHSKYHWNHNFLFDSQEVCANLPKHLRIDVHRHLGERYLSKLKFLDHLSLETKGLIALQLNSISCNQGKHVFRVCNFRY